MLAPEGFLDQPSATFVTPSQESSDAAAPTTPFDDQSPAALQLLISPATPAAPMGHTRQPSDRSLDIDTGASLLLQHLLEPEEPPQTTPGPVGFLPNDSAALLSLVETPRGFSQDDAVIDDDDMEEVDDRINQENDNDSNLLLGLGSGLNVNGLWDNVLGGEERDEPAESETEVPPSTLTFASNDDEDSQPHQSGATVASTPPVLAPISADPWANERRSRAGAYGISVVDEDLAVAFQPIPSFTTVFNATEIHRDDDGGVDGDDDANGSNVYMLPSFFSEVQD